MVLVEPTDVTSPSSGLLFFADAVDDDAASAVGHGGDVLGEIGPRQAFGRRQLGLPVQVGCLGEPGVYDRVDHFVGHRPWGQPQRAVQSSKSHVNDRRRDR